MFFWKTSVLLDALRQLLPKTAQPAGQPAAVRQPQIFRRASQTRFPQCENISIDYAVLERAANVVGIAGRRYRLERRRQLERRLRAARARSRRAMPCARTP